VWLEPGDLMTAVSDVDAKAVVTSETPLEATLVQAIESRLSLLTYPDLKPVAFKTQSRIAPEKTRAEIRLRPAAKLGNSWYAIRLTSLPAGVAKASERAEQIAVAGGAVIARFHPGSFPVIRRVERCGVDGVPWLVVHFSERLHSTSSADVLSALKVVQSSAKVGCESFPSSFPANGLNRVSLRCPSLNMTAASALEMSGTLLSLDGGRLSSMDGAPFARYDLANGQPRKCQDEEVLP